MDLVKELKFDVKEKFLLINRLNNKLVTEKSKILVWII